MTETITARIDQITKIPASHLRPDAPAPKSCKIELTNICNYLCGFCALRMRETPGKRQMEWATFKRLARELRDFGVEELGLFFLGESFSRSELLIDACRYAKQEVGFPYVFLTSNASIADAEEVEALMQAGLDSLKWSVNAADEEQFAKVMGVSPKYFHKALRNIKAAHAIRERGGYQTRLYASSIQYDGEQQAKMEALLDEHVRPFTDQTYWLPLYSMGAVATQREEELGYRPTAGNQGRLGALREPLPCWSAFTEMHISLDPLDGRPLMSACCFDADSRFTMADLTQMSVADAWNSVKFQALRAAHLKRDVTGTICQDCIAYR